MFSQLQVLRQLLDEIPILTENLALKLQEGILVS
jgi:hypothetical protein